MNSQGVCLTFLSPCWQLVIDHLQRWIPFTMTNRWIVDGIWCSNEWLSPPAAVICLANLIIKGSLGEKLPSYEVLKSQQSSSSE